MTHRLLTQAAVCPVWSQHQAGPLWGMTPRSAAYHLRALEADGWVAGVSVAARRIRPGDGPLYRHEPGRGIDPTVCERLAATCLARYRAAPVRPCRLYALTAKARRVLGCEDLKPMPHKAAHDLMVMDVFLANRHRGQWRYEPQPPGGRVDIEVQVDAGLFGPDGLPVVWLEVVTEYRSDRLNRLMAFSEGSGVPLEVI